VIYGLVSGVYEKRRWDVKKIRDAKTLGRIMISLHLRVWTVKNKSRHFIRSGGFVEEFGL